MLFDLSFVHIWVTTNLNYTKRNFLWNEMKNNQRDICAGWLSYDYLVRSHHTAPHEFKTFISYF